jgi:hypothetical protein
MVYELRRVSRQASCWIAAGAALLRGLLGCKDNTAGCVATDKIVLASWTALNLDLETGEVVSREDIARGYEVGKGQYLVVEDEEFEAIQIESTRTIDIDQFVPRSELDGRYIDSPYYIVPDGQVGQDAFAVIRDTIGKMNMVAFGRVVLTRRERARQGRTGTARGQFDGGASGESTGCRSRGEVEGPTGVLQEPFADP